MSSAPVGLRMHESLKDYAALRTYTEHAESITINFKDGSFIQLTDIKEQVR
jgi:hypothetical protein